MSEAINQALREEMRSQPELTLLGQDIGAYGGTFGVYRGLFEEFGAERVRDGPLCESSTVGFGIGLAIADRAINLHRGTISIRNKPDGGLVVEMCFPFAVNSQATSIPKDSKSATDGDCDGRECSAGVWLARGRGAWARISPFARF